MRYSSSDAQLQRTRINTDESIKLVNKLFDTFFYRLAVCLLYIPYVAKFSRPKNFANRFQKGGAEIFVTKIFAKAALIHCIIL